MTLLYDSGQVALHHGHVLDVLRELPDASVNCVVTSPPYWGLRAYGTEPQVWGGWACGSVEETGEHEWGAETNVGLGKGHTAYAGDSRTRWQNPVRAGESAIEFGKASLGQHCLCGAWRGELGSEPTIEMFVEHMVEIFSEVKRVLDARGVMFLNLADSYAGSGKGPSESLNKANGHSQGINSAAVPIGLKPKDLCGIPWRVVLALQADGWYWRSTIVWAKKSPMPESVRDRPTSAWEPVFLLSKSERYHYDADAVRESAIYGRSSKTNGAAGMYGRVREADPRDQRENPRGATTGFNPSAGRNQRNVWLLGPDPEPAAHFATFPRELVRRCVLAGCPDGGVVLDPFVGSGRSAEVAVALGRRAIGIDLNLDYLQTIAITRNQQLGMLSHDSPPSDLSGPVRI